MNLFGCELMPLAPSEVEAALEVIGQRAPAPVAWRDLEWLLGFCHDGVVWGCREGDTWHLSGDVFPEVSPTPSRGSLLELRLFGQARELLMWRHGAEFRGRWLETRGLAPGAPAELKPLPETYVVRGNRLQATRGGFSRVCDETGARHAVPWVCEDAGFAGGEWPLRLKVEHYLAQDEDTGAVRIAASRLVELFREETRRGVSPS